MKRSEKKLYTIDNPKKSNLLTFFAFLFCIYTVAFTYRQGAFSYSRGKNDV